MPVPDVENLYGIVFVLCDDPAHACRCGDLLALLPQADRESHIAQVFSCDWLIRRNKDRAVPVLPILDFMSALITAYF